MTTKTHQLWIDCSPSELFSVLMDPASNRRWQTGVVDTRASEPGPAKVGTTMTEVREFAGCNATIGYRLVELEWGRRAVVRLIDGPLRGTASYACRARDGGTEFRVTCDVTPQGRWRFAGRAVSGLLCAELLMSCQRLKSLLEHPASSYSDQPALGRPGRQLVTAR